MSFDPKQEDAKRDLSHREIAERAIAAAAHELGVPVAWVAAFHDDHTSLRHIHALVIAKARLLPVVAMREAATQAARDQRRERDLGQGHLREPKPQREEGRVREKELSK